MSIVPDRLAKTTRGGIAPVARWLHALGVSANAVTVLGFLITVAGAALLATGQPWPALGVLLVGTLSDTLDGQIARAAGGGTPFGAALLSAGQPWPALGVLLVGTLSDTLDGQIARAAGGGTPFGAFLDSTLDRLSDAALAIAAVQLGASMFEPLDPFFVSLGTADILFWGGLLLLVASFVVSYIRAKAESLGVGASVGLAPREARIAIYLLGVAAWAATGNPQLFAAAVLVAAFLATVTVIQRIAHMATVLNEKKG